MVDERPNGPQTTEAETSEGYPRFRYILMLVLLGLLLALMIGAQWADLGAGADQTADSQAALEARVSAYTWASAAYSPDGRIREPTSDQMRDRRGAIARYETMVEDSPSPESIRRLIVLEFPDQRGRAIERLREYARREGVSGLRQRELLSEASMWQDIYVNRSPIEKPEIRDFAERIRGMDLGWFTHLALADLYDRAGMVGEAQEQRAAAANFAQRKALFLGGLSLAMIVIGFVGVVLILSYVGRLRNRLSQERMRVAEMPSAERERTSGQLLEIFVAYLSIVLGTQLVLALILAAYDVSGTILANEVFVVPAIYVLGGVLAFVYLWKRLRIVTWSWDIIGLVSSNPARDVLWGLGGYAAALPLIVLLQYVSRLFERYTSGPVNPVVPLFGEAQGFGFLVLLVLVTVAAPFFEEVFFRGVLFTSFRARWGLLLGVVLSALVFAFVHPLPAGFLPILALGSVFAILRYERRSVFPSMIAHALNNGMAFVLMYVLLGV